MMSAETSRIRANLTEAGLFSETAKPRVNHIFLVQYSSGVSRIPCQLRCPCQLKCTSSITPRENDIYKQKVEECVTQHSSCPVEDMTYTIHVDHVPFCCPPGTKKFLASPVPLTLTLARPSAYELLLRRYHAVEHPSYEHPKCVKDHHH